jgi:hypothetical protein
MYDKRRVVLSQHGLVSISGGKCYFPIGFYFYGDDGKLYADLKSPDQWYRLVNRETIANKRLGGCATRQALREFVMAYYKEIESEDKK